jgi:hypothetical protein
MLPNGCFGSSLAYAPKSAACKACPAQRECAAIVNARYPTLMRHLARFTDSSGVRVAEHWLNPTDKRRLKERRKAIAQREADKATFGDPAVGQKLRANLDKRAEPILDKCVQERINPLSADLNALSTVSKPMSSAITALFRAPQHRDTIARSIASESGLSASTAKRETDALISFLKLCGRIALKNNIVEIK